MQHWTDWARRWPHWAPNKWSCVGMYQMSEYCCIITYKYVLLSERFTRWLLGYKKKRRAVRVVARYVGNETEW